MTLDELWAQIPEWKLPDVPDDADEDTLLDVIAEIDQDDPPLMT